MRDRSSRPEHLIAALLLSIVLVGAAGCAGGLESPTAPPPGLATGVLSISLTDAPIEEVLELNVYIAELKLKPDGGPAERFASTVGLVDLLTLQNGVTELLGQDQVDAGLYQFIELLLDQDQSHVIETATGEPKPLTIPSETIKIAGGPFEVLADGTTSILVDFDAEKSLKKTGNGRFQLEPFVSIVQVTLSSG